jgi:hypothetical protein
MPSTSRSTNFGFRGPSSSEGFGAWSAPPEAHQISSMRGSRETVTADTSGAGVGVGVIVNVDHDATPTPIPMPIPHRTGDPQPAAGRESARRRPMAGLTPMLDAAEVHAV